MDTPVRPYVGQMVCDCNVRHLRVISIDDDGDTVVFEDGGRCSYRHCCTDLPHAEEDVCLNYQVEEVKI